MAAIGTTVGHTFSSSDTTASNIEKRVVSQTFALPGVVPPTAVISILVSSLPSVSSSQSSVVSSVLSSQSSVVSSVLSPQSSVVSSVLSPQSSVVSSVLSPQSSVVSSVLSPQSPAGLSSLAVPSSSFTPSPPPVFAGSGKVTLLGTIIGGTVAGLLVLGAIIWCLARRRRLRRESGYNISSKEISTVPDGMRSIRVDAGRLAQGDQELVTLRGGHGQEDMQISVPVLPTMAFIGEDLGSAPGPSLTPTPSTALTTYPRSVHDPSCQDMAHSTGDPENMQNITELVTALYSLVNDPSASASMPLRQRVEQLMQHGDSQTDPNRRIHQDSGLRTSGLIIPSRFNEDETDETRSLPPVYTRN